MAHKLTKPFKKKLRNKVLINLYKFRVLHQKVEKLGKEENGWFKNKPVKKPIEIIRNRMKIYQRLVLFREFKNKHKAEPKLNKWDKLYQCKKILQNQIEREIFSMYLQTL